MNVVADRFPNPEKSTASGDMKENPLPLIGDRGTRVLIAGSLPGQYSMAVTQYYAHPGNHFWRLMGDVLAEDLAGRSYPDRIARLSSRGIGLWDSIGRAVRSGSLDSGLRHIEPRQVDVIAATCPDLLAIAFNGKAAARAGRSWAAALSVPMLVLPSSSAAMTLPYARKLAAWMELESFLS